MKALVVAEHRRGALRETTLESIAAAQVLGADSVDVLVIGEDPHPLVAAVSVTGVDRVLVATAGAAFSPDVYRVAAGRAAAHAAADVVIAGNTVDTMSYAAGVAVDGGRALLTDVVGLEATDEGLVTDRSFYAGKVEARVAAPGAAVVLVRPGAFAPASGTASPVVEALPGELPAPRVRHRSYVEADGAGDLDIAQERFLLAIGRGVGEEGNIEVFEELAVSLGATLVSSRPLVDSGWMAASRLVGQSGKTVKPAVYLAFGISGAIQHLAGMKTSETIIAVNHDPEASIFTVAHFGAVADIFDVAEELAKRC